MPGVNPSVNSGLWMTRGQCRFIDCKKYTTLVQGFDTGEAVHMLGQEVYGKSLYFPLNSAVNLKLLIKTQSIKNIYIVRKGND